MEKRMVHAQALPFCINDHTDQSQDPNISIEENFKSRRNEKQLESSKETQKQLELLTYQEANTVLH